MANGTLGVSQIDVLSTAGTGTISIVPPATNTNRTLTLPDNTGTIVTTGGASSLTTSGNLTFTGTGNRITGDFSNATLANRVVFQTSTTNGATGVGAIPNGTSVSANFRAYNNSDPTNASFVDIQPNATEASVRSGATGTGTLLPMTFVTGGSERMRIDTSGNLGLGVTPSAWGSDYKALQIGPRAAFLADTVGAYVANNFYFDGTNSKYLATGGASLFYQTSNRHEWYTAPSGTAGNAITFTQVLAVEGGKSLALQGATSQTGTGITFPATQSASTDANTLDDYEEGTWTPTIIGGSSSGTGTYTSQVGRYTKIGNLVYVTCWVDWSAHTGTGDMSISNLPFTSQNATNLYQSGIVGNIGSLAIGANCVPGILISPNGVNMSIRSTPISGGTSAGTSMDTSASIAVSACYVV